MSYTFAIGDIHGCRAQLLQLLSVIEFSATGGRIVFLGDYVDRGPDSRGVVERLMAGPQKSGWEWVTLKGNHEAMMVGALRDNRDVELWLANGGAETRQSYDGDVPREVLGWMASLPPILIDRHRIFVHAGVDREVPLDRQSLRTLLWSRPVSGDNGPYWDRHLCHGHTPTEENPVTIGNRTNIDSGCVFGGMLTAAVFDDNLPGAPIRFLTIPNRDVI